MVKICKMSQLDQLKELPNGCLVDTNILFALNNAYDKFHEDAYKSFLFVKDRILVYTNVNIKLEFIDLLRRLIIPKHLMGLHQNKKDLGSGIEEKLENLKDNLDKSKIELKTFKLSDWEIKEWRRLLSRSHLKNATRDNSFRKNTSFALYKTFHEMAFTQNE